MSEKCARCGSTLTLEESSMGGLCHICRDFVKDELDFLDDDDKRPPEIKTADAQAAHKRGDVLLRAHEIINGQRQDTYGQPEDCFASIARLWNAYLTNYANAYDSESENCRCSFPRLYAGHVAHMMALMKIARMQHGAGSEDNAADCCGYIALAEDMRMGA